MSTFSEQQPLNPNNNVNYNQPVQSVRGNFQHSIVYILKTSYALLTSRMALIIGLVNQNQIITESLILGFMQHKTSQPISIYIYGCLVFDVVSLIGLILQIPYVKRARENQPVDETCFNNSYSIIAFISYICWQIPGNLWFWKCDDCLEDAPEMSYLALSLLVIGYIYIFIPLLLMVSLCLCLPFAIIFIMYLSNSAQNPANETVIRNLHVENYDPNKHIGEPNCSICTVDYNTTDRIVLLRCDERHFFHEECIERWLRINANCPICRSSLLSYSNN